MAPHDRTDTGHENPSSAMLLEPLLQTTEQECAAVAPPSGQDDNDSSLEALTDSVTAAAAASSTPMSPSRNVTIILWYTFSVFAGRSIWNQNVLANFAFLLSDGDPKAVGFLTAAMGITQLLVSFPAGFLADKYRRDTILKVSSVIGVAAILTTMVALHYGSFYWLLTSLSVWGVYWGCAQTAVQALFADSIPDGQRAHYFTTRSILIKIGQLAGPVGALIMFAILGDRWTIHDCSIVMMAGQIICLPAVFLLWFLNDDEAVPHQEATNLQEPLLLQNNHQDDNDEENPRGSSTSDREGEVECIETQETDTTSADCNETYDAVQLGRLFPFISKARVIPTLVAAGDVTAGLASGMSIRYFPIFLGDNLRVDPVLVQVIYILAPLLQVGLMKLIQLLAKRGGRCFMAVVFKWIGIALMLTMVVSYTRGWPVWVTCTILVWRTAVMNTPSALTRSVLMDNVKKEERAKWSALESLNTFSWSGSAVIGGLLVAKEGIVFNFCATAFLQFLASIPLLILSCYRKPRHHAN